MTTSTRDRWARGEVIRLVECCRELRSVESLQEVAAKADHLRDTLGEPRVRRLFEEVGLLDLCVEKALDAERARRSDMAKLLICFAIDNLPDEDEARKAFYHHDTGALRDVVVPRRRRPQQDPCTAELNPAC